MLSKRVFAALVFVPLVLVLIYIGSWGFNLFIIAVLLAAGYEFTQLCRKMGYHPIHAIILIGILAFAGQRWFFEGQYLEFLITALLTLGIVVALLQYERGSDTAAMDFFIHMGGMFYLGWIGAFFINFRALPDGRGWMLTALPATWLADSGAYFLGRWLGKSKLAPILSPKKTWAGYIGGIAAGMVSGVLLILLWRAVNFLPTETPLWQGAVMGCVLAILTPIGDLMISLFKRTAGVKDTSNIIPGHGGILDRIDTWIWAAMLGYYLVKIF